MRSASIFIAFLLGLSSGTALCQTAPAQLPPDPRMKADILLIVAHPDDETAIGGYLAQAVFDEGKRVGIIYFNRGGGGGNSFGNEQSTAMGAIREIEARQAVAAFGITNVWFLDGRDTPGQDLFLSLENWHHGARLEETVRLIRLTRPEVIITWLPHFVAGENHGDHQAAGVIATEAFDLAGDPTTYPEQVIPPRERTDINNATEGLEPWQPKKLYYFSDASHPVNGPGPAFDLGAVSPSKKVPYYRLAAALHLPHRTQGDVSQVAEKAITSGDFSDFQKWLGMIHLLFGKAIVSCRPEGGVFDGITSVPAPFTQPPGYHHVPSHGVSLALGGAFGFYRDFWRSHGIESVGPLVPPEISISAGSYFYLPLILRNDTNDSVTVRVASESPATWKELSGGAEYRLAPGEARPIQIFMRAPGDVAGAPQKITWKASTSGKVVGKVSIDVSVGEWTLPE